MGSLGLSPSSRDDRPPPGWLLRQRLCPGSKAAPWLLPLGDSLRTAPPPGFSLQTKPLKEIKRRQTFSSPNIPLLGWAWGAKSVPRIESGAADGGKQGLSQRARGCAVTAPPQAGRLALPPRALPQSLPAALHYTALQLCRAGYRLHVCACACMCACPCTCVRTRPPARSRAPGCESQFAPRCSPSPPPLPISTSQLSGRLPSNRGGGREGLRKGCRRGEAGRGWLLIGSLQHAPPPQWSLGPCRGAAVLF